MFYPQASSGQSAAARFAGSAHFFYSILGLAPQALFCRPLRGLSARSQVRANRSNKPHRIRGFLLQPCILGTFSLFINCLPIAEQ
jgi:hypothetical protein